jgi:hypothetical protein
MRDEDHTYREGERAASRYDVVSAGLIRSLRSIDPDSPQ